MTEQPETFVSQLVEREVFAFLDALRSTGMPPPYAPHVIRQFGLSAESTMALCARWVARQQELELNER